MYIVKSIKLFIYRIYGLFNNPVNKILYANEGTNDGSIISKRIKGFKSVGLGKNIAIPEFCVFNGSVKIGDCTTLGIHNMFFGEVEIGKYCQLGAYVAVHGTNHPINYLSTYINYRLFDGELAKLKTSKPVTIRNDVWIGHGAIILSGVTIGNGAIIAAGSVVTKDIEPYTIVAGNPAKPIRKRFSDSLIKEIEQLKWWDMPNNELEKSKELFFTDLSTIETLTDLKL